MSDRSAIEWTEATWNPVRGCTPVSPGCGRCYARTFAERWRGVLGHPYEQGFDVRLVPEALYLPLRWRKPRRVFVNSMSDLFHDAVPDAFIADVFNVMKLAPEHVFQVLTKRAARMRAFVTRYTGACLPLPNVWLGVSVENQAAADERNPHLLATPAAVRFLSCEPLLGPVPDLLRPRTVPGSVSLLDTRRGPDGELHAEIDWVIVGGESGPRARPCDVAWIRSLVEQCRGGGVPVFVKQMGSAWANGGKGSDPQQWDPDLRVRQMPEVTT